MKNDGFPTYHLANVVDDHLMKISHVIRGEVSYSVLLHPLGMAAIDSETRAPVQDAVIRLAWIRSPSFASQQ